MTFSTNPPTIKFSFCSKRDWCVECNLMATSHLYVHWWVFSTHQPTSNHLTCNRLHSTHHCLHSTYQCFHALYPIHQHPAPSASVSRHTLYEQKSCIAAGNRCKWPCPVQRHTVFGVKVCIGEEIPLSRNGIPYRHIHSVPESMYRDRESVQMALSRTATQFFSMKNMCREKRRTAETGKSRRHRQHGPKVCVATEYTENGETSSARHKKIAQNVCVARCLE